MIQKTHILVLLLVWLGATEASADHLAYTGKNQDVLELQIRNGQALPDTRTWTFDDIGRLQSIDRHAGTLYLVGFDDPTDDEILFVADLETSTATEIHNFGSLIHTDIAFDDSGVLWIVASTGDLYTYDPVTDTQSFVLTLDIPLSPRGLAWYNGRLHVLLQPLEPRENGPIFGVVDLGTGALTEQRELPGLLYDGPSTRVFDSLDFDDAGGLWMGIVDTFGLIDPPVVGGTAYFESPWHDPEPTAHPYSEAYLGAVPWSVSGSTPAVAVPTADSLGMGLLCGLLALSAVVLLNRRRA